MAIGVDGVLLDHARRNVVVEYKNELVLAPTQNLHLAVRPVTAQGSKVDLATSEVVQ